MALTQEDLEMLGQFIDQKIQVATQNVMTVPPVVEDSPDVAFRKESEPWYYVHLADGRVLETQDSSATHMEGMAVIGRYPKGE